MTDSLKSHWEGRYSDNADSGLSWTESDPFISREWVINSASPDQHVVDIGAGRSKLLGQLLDAGFTQLTHVELTEAASNDMRATLGENSALVSWYVGDAKCWRTDLPAQVWHDRAVFHFLTDPNDRKAYIAAVDENLAANGTVIIATFHLTGPQKCSGLPVQQYDAQALLETFNSLSQWDWRLDDELVHQHLTPGGNSQIFQYAKLTRL
jgi:hypothetical protein